MSCTITTSGFSSTTECSMDFSTGGGIGFNADVQLVNPAPSATLATLDVVAPPPNVASIDYGVPLYSGTVIVYAVGALTVSLKGSGAASGTASATAAFVTQAELDVGINQAGTLTQGFSEAVMINPPSLQSTLTVEEISLTITVTPTVYWKIGFGVTTGSYPVELTTGMFAFVTTPIPASYTYTEVFSNTDDQSTGNVTVTKRLRRELDAACTDTETLELNAEVTGYSVEFLSNTYSVPAPAVAAGTTVATDGNTQV